MNYGVESEMRKVVCIALLGLLPWVAARAGEAPRPAPMIPGFKPMNNPDGTDDVSDDMSAPAKYDEVVHDLIEQLLNKRVPVKSKEPLRLKKKKEDEERDAATEREQFTVNAQDAAKKLAGLGKRAVPDLTFLFRTNYNHTAKDAGAERAQQIAYYSAWALARIRSIEAARALIPLMTNPAAPPDLRLIAVDAAGWEKSAEGVAILEQAASSDSDMEIRKHALGQLSMIPEYWLRSEPIFVKALSDPSEEIRVQAAKACHFSHMFASANGKLIELLEKDPSPMVRLYAMLTVARLKVQKAQPALIRVLKQPDADDKTRKQAFNAMVAITDVPFRSVDNIMAWWEKSGRNDFETVARNEKQAAERADDIKNKRPIKGVAKRIPLDSDSALTGAILPAPKAIIGEVISLDETEPAKVTPKGVETDVVAVPDAPTAIPPTVIVTAVAPKFIDPPDDSLSPKESSGSQRRRLRKTD